MCNSKAKCSVSNTIRKAMTRHQCTGGVDLLLSPSEPWRTHVSNADSTCRSQSWGVWGYITVICDGSNLSFCFVLCRYYAYSVVNWNLLRFGLTPWDMGCSLNIFCIHGISHESEVAARFILIRNADPEVPLKTEQLPGSGSAGVFT